MSRTLQSGMRVRWSAARKLEVVEALRGGETIDELSKLYGIPVSEIAIWRDRFNRYGLDGLKATKLQTVRRAGRHALSPGEAAYRARNAVRGGR